MNTIYERIYLFGRQKSRGTFEDFYDPDKYSSIEHAWMANDYVEADFVKDGEGALFIELKHSKTPHLKRYHRLIYQKPILGIDVSDDEAAGELADTLINENK